MSLRGTTPPHLAAAAISASPLGYSLYQIMVHSAHLPVVLTALTGLVAALPWLSRQVARMAARAELDDLAVHIRGEAVFYRSLTAVAVVRTRRRRTLRLERGSA